MGSLGPARKSRLLGSPRRRSGSPPARPGSSFSCKLDKKKLRPCTSPRTYKQLEPGKHVFRVKGRDRAGNLDASPAAKRFKIRKR